MLDTVWYYARNSQAVGPVPFADLHQLASTGRLLATDLVLQAGTQQWVVASSVQGLFLQAGIAPPPLPNAAAPGGETGPTSYPARSFWTWLSREARETTVASCGQARRLLRYGMALWRQRALCRTAAAAGLVLGQRLYQAGLGDGRLRARIAAVDDQIRRAEVAKQPLGALHSERNGVLLQLSADALGRHPASPEIARDLQTAQSARAECERHRAQLQGMRASLYPAEKAARARSALGCAAAAASIALLLWFCVGSGPSPRASSDAEAHGPPAADPATQRGRLAYRFLAQHLSDSWGESRQKPPAQADLAHVAASAQNEVLNLDALRIEDADLRLIRDEARGATQEAIAALRKLEQLPRPPSSGELFLTGFLSGFSGRFDLAAEAGMQAQSRVDATLSQLRALNSAYQRACSAKLLLKRAAPRYAGTALLSGVAIDIDEAFILDPDDWVALINGTGRPLHNALVMVYLTGLGGESKENLHFVPEWRPGQQLHAAYPAGITVDGMVIGRQTVRGIQSARVRVLSDEGQVAEFTYVYAGAEKGKDVRREFDVVRPGVAGSCRAGAFGSGKVFVLHNQTGRTLPAVSVATPAGTCAHGPLAPGGSFEVGRVQVSRNLQPRERVVVFVGGHELCSFTVDGP